MKYIDNAVRSGAFSILMLILWVISGYLVPLILMLLADTCVLVNVLALIHRCILENSAANYGKLTLGIAVKPSTYNSWIRNSEKHTKVLYTDSKHMCTYTIIRTLDDAYDTGDPVAFFDYLGKLVYCDECRNAYDNFAIEEVDKLKDIAKKEGVI